MTVVVAQNQTLSDIFLDRVNVTVPGNGSATLTDFATLNEIQDDELLRAAIIAEDILLEVDGFLLSAVSSLDFAFGARAGARLLRAGENLSVGDIVSHTNAGQVVRASPVFANSVWNVLGTARQTVSSGGIVSLGTAGTVAPVRFAAAPAGANNGQLVFLSGTTGAGSLVPPVGSGNVVFVVGVLQGADGSTTVPEVLIQPQYVSRRP